ncbi:selenocysteine-specific translation elongation factor [Luteococcus sp. H138]|uniref:selenocysteine-specific translation elongation factor n=1 Tax=unclassified Luteococcus TaxID=2639923 RepID=UPI00313CBFE0
MRVIATAGHVDHGKSTLVRALTGTDPDRWAEEHRRGLTIDLGYVWARLPVDRGAEEVVFVDVPGHQRFIANMLAGVGPVPAVMFVVAADEGWRRQSAEHLAAIRALGIEHGVLVITRSDLADPAPALAQTREQLADTPLASCEAVTVSAATGEGLAEVRAALGRLCGALPEPTVDGRVRLWIDRVFTVKGAGTVITGTLGQGTLRLGDQVRLHTASGQVSATIRGLQALEQARAEVPAVARVAVNLRGIATDQLTRGDALLHGAWRTTASVDARLDAPGDDLPEHLMAHVGTAAMQVRVRPLAGDAVRLSWQNPLPLRVGDRMILRDPGQQHVLCGALVLDVDPPELTRRGAGRRRGEELLVAGDRINTAREVARRGWMRASDLLALGVDEQQIAAAITAGTLRSPGPREVAGNRLLVSPAQWTAWADDLGRVTDRAIAENPLQARISLGAAAGAVGLPERALAEALAPDAGLRVSDGHLERPGTTAHLGEAEVGLAELEARLEAHPFAAPERDELAALGLGPKQIAAAVRLGRLLDLDDQIVLAPLGPARAMRKLAALPQPFTTSQARQALGSTRRVVIPLLEHLDAKGWTRRLDAGHREVVRSSKEKR